MNVDAARERVPVLLLLAVEREHPRDDGVAPGRVRLQYFSGRAQALENRTGRQLRAEFLRDAKNARRRAIAAELIAETIFRSGDFVGGDPFAPVDHEHLLVGHADYHFGLSPGGAAGGNGAKHNGEELRDRHNGALCSPLRCRPQQAFCEPPPRVPGPPSACYGNFTPRLAGEINGVQHLHEVKRLLRVIYGLLLPAHSSQKVLHLRAELIFVPVGLDLDFYDFAPLILEKRRRLEAECGFRSV